MEENDQKNINFLWNCSNWPVYTALLCLYRASLVTIEIFSLTTLLWKVLVPLCNISVLILTYCWGRSVNRLQLQIYLRYVCNTYQLWCKIILKFSRYRTSSSNYCHKNVQASNYLVWNYLMSNTKRVQVPNVLLKCNNEDKCNIISHEHTNWMTYSKYEWFYVNTYMII